MILGTSSGMTGLTVTLYQKSDSSLSSDKTTITLGCMRGVDDNLQRTAIAFNEENESYQIDFVDYSQYEDPYTKINVDITTGKAPDIIDLSYLPVRQYAEKGVLEDLTPYYENDDDIGIELLIPSVAKAMQIDGAYYYVSPGFAINTLVAAADDVGGKTGWTFDDMQTLLENKGRDTRPFFTEHKDEILYNLLWSSVDDYIDWNTGTCSFESDDFKSMLEISNLGKTGKADYDDGSPMDPQLLKDGKVLFDTYSSGKASSIQEYEKMYDRDIALIGYPNQEKNGSYFRFDEYVMLSIYSKSKLKDGAWEFVKTFMTRDYQINENNYMIGTPTNQEAFEMYMKQMTAKEIYTDELGQTISPTDYEMGYGDGAYIQIGPLSEKEEETYRNLIENTSRVYYDDDTIADIIVDEAAPYFAGQKSLDDTVEIIQNVITIYVNENR